MKTANARARELSPAASSNRGGLTPSAPRVAAYGSGALIAWEAGGDLYTVERNSAGVYSAATQRSGVESAVTVDGVRVAASRRGTGVVVWQESGGSGRTRIGARSFRGVP